MAARPHINGFIPSDTGLWRTLFRDGDPHVLPGFGPAHMLSIACWCHPVWNITRYEEDVVLHNVAQ